MNTTSIYGEHMEAMEDVLAFVLQKLYGYRESIKSETGIDPVDHVLSRIKTEESMREKCRLHNLPETVETALEVIHDAIGLRVVCPFLNDVYEMASRIEADPDLPVAEKRDYILQAKEFIKKAFRAQEEKGLYSYVELLSFCPTNWGVQPKDCLKYCEEHVLPYFPVGEFKSCF